jgi:hypothetical protein
MPERPRRLKFFNFHKKLLKSEYGAARFATHGRFVLAVGRELADFP